MSNIPEMPDYESIEQFTKSMKHLTENAFCLIHNADVLFANKGTDITNLSSIIDNLGDRGYDEKHLDGGFTGERINKGDVLEDIGLLGDVIEIVKVFTNAGTVFLVITIVPGSEANLHVYQTTDFVVFSLMEYCSSINFQYHILKTYTQVLNNTIDIIAILDTGTDMASTQNTAIRPSPQRLTCFFTINANGFLEEVKTESSNNYSLLTAISENDVSRYIVRFNTTSDETNSSTLQLTTPNGITINLDSYSNTENIDIICAKMFGNIIYILYYNSGAIYRSCYSIDPLFHNNYLNNVKIFQLITKSIEPSLSDETYGPLLIRLFSSLNIHIIKGHVVYTLGDQIRNFFDDTVVYSSSSYDKYSDLTEIPICKGFLFTNDKVYAHKINQSTRSIDIVYPTKDGIWESGTSYFFDASTAATPTSYSSYVGTMAISSTGDLYCFYNDYYSQQVCCIYPIYKDLMVQKHFLPTNCTTIDWTGNVVSGTNTFYDFRSWDVFKTDVMNNVRSCIYVEKIDTGYFVCTTSANTIFHIKVTANSKPIVETYAEISGVTKSNVILYQFDGNIYFTDGTNAYLVNPSARAYQKSTTSTILPSSAARPYFTSAKNTYSRRYRYVSNTEHYIIERNETTTQTKIYKFIGATPSAWALNSTLTLNGIDNGDLHYHSNRYFFSGKIDSSGEWQGICLSAFPTTRTLTSITAIPGSQKHPSGYNWLKENHNCYIRDSFDSNFTKVITTGGAATLDVKNNMHPTNNLVTEVDWLATLTDSTTNVTAYYVFNLDMNWGSYLSYCIESPVMYRIHSGSFIMSENNYNNDECQLIFPYYQTTDYATQPHHCFYAVEMRDSDLTLNFRLTCSNLYQIGEEEDSLLKWFDCSNIAVVRKDNTINAQVFTTSVNNISDKISCFFNNRTWRTLSSITNGDFNGKIFDWYLITIAH